VAVWIALSVLGSPGDDPGPAEEAAAPEAPPEPPPPSTLSFRLDPPPEVVTNPEIPEEPPPPEPPETGQNAWAVGGVFAPEELAQDWSQRSVGLVRAGANEMVPVISRMEPVGRRLDPDHPVPKAARIELKPPDPEEDARNRRPRLSAPPAATGPAPVSPQPGARRRYTIMLGSFSKEANAVSLRERLESEGLPAEVLNVTVNNLPYWRVMSGVFEDQAAAEAYGRELRRKNLVDRPIVMTM
jgi:cell division septation protein DedD